MKTADKMEWTAL